MRQFTPSIPNHAIVPPTYRFNFISIHAFTFHILINRTLKHFHKSIYFRYNQTTKRPFTHPTINFMYVTSSIVVTQVHLTELNTKYKHSTYQPCTQDTYPIRCPRSTQQCRTHSVHNDSRMYIEPAHSVLYNQLAHLVLHNQIAHLVLHSQTRTLSAAWSIRTLSASYSFRTLSATQSNRTLSAVHFNPAHLAPISWS